MVLKLDAIIRVLFLRVCASFLLFDYTIAAQISISDNFIHRVVVHYYAKGDKCDVTGKHRDVQVRIK